MTMFQVGDQVWVDCGKAEHHATIESIEYDGEKQAKVKWKSNNHVESGIDMSRLSLMFRDDDAPRKRRRATQSTPRIDVGKPPSTKNFKQARCVKIKKDPNRRKAAPNSVPPQAYIHIIDDNTASDPDDSQDEFLSAKQVARKGSLEADRKQALKRSNFMPTPNAEKPSALKVKREPTDPAKPRPVKNSSVTKKSTRALNKECTVGPIEASEDDDVDRYVNPHQYQTPIYTMDDLPPKSQVMVEDGLLGDQTYKATIVDHLDGSRLRIHWDMANYKADVDLWQVRSKVEDLLAEDWTQGPRRSGRRNSAMIDRFIPSKEELKKLPQEPKGAARLCPVKTYNVNQKAGQHPFPRRERIVSKEKRVLAKYSFEYPPAWQRHLSTRGNIWIVDAISPTTAVGVTDVGACDMLGFARATSWTFRGEECMLRWK
jgi:hypothetical protein